MDRNTTDAAANLPELGQAQTTGRKQEHTGALDLGGNLHKCSASRRRRLTRARILTVGEKDKNLLKAVLSTQLLVVGNDTGSTSNDRVVERRAAARSGLGAHALHVHLGSLDTRKGKTLLMIEHTQRHQILWTKALEKLLDAIESSTNARANHRSRLVQRERAVDLPAVRALLPAHLLHHGGLLRIRDTTADDHALSVLARELVVLRMNKMAVWPHAAGAKLALRLATRGVHAVAVIVHTNLPELAEIRH